MKAHSFYYYYAKHYLSNDSSGSCVVLSQSPVDYVTSEYGSTRRTGEGFIEVDDAKVLEIVNKNNTAINLEPYQIVLGYDRFSRENFVSVKYRDKVSKQERHCSTIVDKPEFKEAFVSHGWAVEFAISGEQLVPMIEDRTDLLGLETGVTY